MMQNGSFSERANHLLLYSQVLLTDEPHDSMIPPSIPWRLQFLWQIQCSVKSATQTQEGSQKMGVGASRELRSSWSAGAKVTHDISLNAK
jgi:hypothetical protein